MNTESIIDAIARASAQRPAPGDYMKDGLLYCGHCETPKQCRIKFHFGERIVGCQCACEQRRMEAEKKADEARALDLKIRTLRANGIRDKGLVDCTFRGARMTPELEKCRRYAEHWREMREENSGLLLWGGTGNGKTYAAACIVNDLIDRGIPAMITSFPRILNAGWDKTQIAQEMRYYQLLVIDDLGAERHSDYALETVYMVIDERYKARKPLIVTTNLTLDELCKPPSMEYQRIYDRILEMCVPLAFRGESIRRGKANEKMRKAKLLLEG